MMVKKFTAVLLLFLGTIVAGAADTNFLSKVSPEAWRIHRNAILIDGHNDLP